METTNEQGEKRDFQDTVEDIQIALAKAAEIISAENKALGLPKTYLKDGKIIKEAVDGSIEILGTVEQTPSKYKKGQVLYVNKEK